MNKKGEKDQDIFVRMWHAFLLLCFQVSYYEIYMEKIRDLLDGECSS